MRLFGSCLPLGKKKKNQEGTEPRPTSMRRLSQDNITPPSIPTNNNLPNVKNSNKVRQEHTSDKQILNNQFNAELNARLKKQSNAEAVKPKSVPTQQNKQPIPAPRPKTQATAQQKERPIPAKRPDKPIPAQRPYKPTPPPRQDKLATKNGSAVTMSDELREIHDTISNTSANSVKRASTSSASSSNSSTSKQQENKQTNNLKIDIDSPPELPPRRPSQLSEVSTSGLVTTNSLKKNNRQGIYLKASNNADITEKGEEALEKIRTGISNNKKLSSKAQNILTDMLTSIRLTETFKIDENYLNNQKALRKLPKSESREALETLRSNITAFEKTINNKIHGQTIKPNVSRNTSISDKKEHIEALNLAKEISKKTKSELHQEIEDSNLFVEEESNRKTLINNINNICTNPTINNNENRENFINIVNKLISGEIDKSLKSTFKELPNEQLEALLTISKQIKENIIPAGLAIKKEKIKYVIDKLKNTLESNALAKKKAAKKQKAAKKEKAPKEHKTDKKQKAVKKESTSSIPESIPTTSNANLSNMRPISQEEPIEANGYERLDKFSNIRPSSNTGQSSSQDVDNALFVNLEELRRPKTENHRVEASPFQRPVHSSRKASIGSIASGGSNTSGLTDDIYGSVNDSKRSSIRSTDSFETENIKEDTPPQIPSRDYNDFTYQVKSIEEFKNAEGLHRPIGKKRMQETAAKILNNDVDENFPSVIKSFGLKPLSYLKRNAEVLNNITQTTSGSGLDKETIETALEHINQAVDKKLTKMANKIMHNLETSETPENELQIIKKQINNIITAKPDEKFQQDFKNDTQLLSKKSAELFFDSIDIMRKNPDVEVENCDFAQNTLQERVNTLHIDAIFRPKRVVEYKDQVIAKEKRTSRL